MAKRRNSLIGTIKDSIINETDADVTISENTLLSEIIEDEKEYKNKPYDCEDDTVISQVWQRVWGEIKKLWDKNRYKTHNLALSRCLLTLVWCVLYFFYAVAFSIVYLVVWFVNMLLGGKKFRGKTNIAINLLMTTLTLIFSIWSLVFIFSFIVKDVILSPGDAYTNNEGVTTMNQSSLETQSFFLMNASVYDKLEDRKSSHSWINVWTPTGIQVNNGDDVSLYISGSMYSDISDYAEAAQENRKLKYPQIRYSPFYTSGDSNGVKYAMYSRNSGEKAYFGSLLYSIIGESEKTKIHDTSDGIIHQVDVPPSSNGWITNQWPFFNFRMTRKNKFPWVGIEAIYTPYHFKAKKEEQGMLWFAFNDIFLDSATIESILKDTSSLQCKDLMNVGWEDATGNRIIYGNKGTCYYAISIDNTDAIKGYDSVFHKNSEATDNKSLNKEIIESLLNKKINDSQTTVLDTLLVKMDDTTCLSKKSKLDSVERTLYVSKSLNSLIDTMRTRKHLEVKNKAMWFEDNIGEVLINVRVKQNIWSSNLSPQKQVATWLYRQFENLFAFSKNMGYFVAWIIILVVFFLSDYVISLLIRYRVIKMVIKNVKVLLKKDLS